jgi:hypothetical protein|tara:strand:+ start:1031 stop:1228 length:198 start_codon:yes stop_codon:yes gene_type:complete
MAKSNEEMLKDMHKAMDKVESSKCLYRYFDKEFVNKFYDIKDEIAFLINDDYWNDADEPKTLEVA